MSLVGDPMQSIKDQIRGFVPSKFNLGFMRPGRSTIAVTIDLEGYPHKRAVQQALKKGQGLVGVSLQRRKSGTQLLVSGRPDQIVARMKACKEQVLTAA